MCSTSASLSCSSVECPILICECFIITFLAAVNTMLIMIFDCRDDWSKFTDYRGYEKTDQVIEWFWQCIRSWPAEKKARLLQFTTGTSRVPVNGFKDLQGSDGPRRFTIEKSGDPSGLPRSHTCFNRLDLPPYEDYESLEQKLSFAIESVFFFLSLLRIDLNSLLNLQLYLEKRKVLVKSDPAVFPCLVSLFSIHPPCSH